MNIISTIFLLFSVLAISFPIQAVQDFDEADLEAGIQASLASYYGHHFEEEIEKPFQPEEIKAHKSAEENFLFKYAASHITTVWLSDRTYCETSAEIVDIFLNPNYQKWQALLTTSTFDFSRTPTAVDVIFLLNKLQRTAVFGAIHFRQLVEKQISQTLVFLANQALLQIFSGCWGFSKNPLPREIESQLKDVLYGVGQTNQQFQKDQDTFFNTVQYAFQENGYYKNPSLQNHFLTVFTYATKKLIAG